MAAKTTTKVKTRHVSVSVAISVGGSLYTRLRYRPGQLLARSHVTTDEILTAIEQAASFAARLNRGDRS